MISPSSFLPCNPVSMILALEIEGHRLGGELAAEGLRTCLALSWQELVLAVAAIAWWPRACGLPCAGSALGAPGAGGWHPDVVTAGQTASPG